MIKKILGTICIGILAFGISGCDVKFGSMSYKDYINEDSFEIVNKSTPWKEKEVSLDLKQNAKDIKSIDIKMDAGSVEFEGIDGDSIEILAKGNKDSIKSDIKDGKLIIENKEKNIIGNNIGTEMTIGVPKNFNEDVNVSIGAGLAVFNDISLKNLDVNIGTGLTVSNQSVSAEKLNVSQGVGAILMMMNNTNEVNIKQDTGQVIFCAKNIIGKINVDNKIGDLRIGYLQENNPKLDVKTKVGNENKKVKTNTNISEKGSIKARVNIGNLEIGNISKEEFEQIDSRNFNMDHFEMMDEILND